MRLRFYVSKCENYTGADPKSFVRGAGVQNRFFCIGHHVYGGERGPYLYSKRATIGPPAKGHFSAVSLVRR